MKLLVVIVNYRTAGARDRLPAIARAGSRRRARRHASSSPTTSPATTRSRASAPRSTTTAGPPGRRSCPCPPTAGSPTATTRHPPVPRARRQTASTSCCSTPTRSSGPARSRELVQFMDAHPDVGIAGSRLEDPDGTPQVSAFRFHSILSEFEHGDAARRRSASCWRSWRRRRRRCRTEACPTDWVCGASMIDPPRGVREDRPARRAVLHVLRGGRLLPARPSGPAGRAGTCRPAGSSTSSARPASVSDVRRHRKRRPAYWFESRRRYFTQNHGRLYALLADAAYATAFALWRVRRFVQRKPDTDPPQFLWDFVRHSTWWRD